jgi:hypothetical protein
MLNFLALLNINTSTMIIIQETLIQGFREVSLEEFLVNDLNL